MLEVVVPIDYPWIKVEEILFISALSDNPTVCKGRLGVTQS
ncbi:hypothetical protein HanXRQr2_Chr02g0080721 [Helianthus annuus]|uniref:Uncharacterized protein n=1 Tax=Helianthus annuus TaxID=4232 RepID=A0A9K3JSD5_HELAN|nr:hypothetical protein HanXRQr2_Chr02g0080721 [Helianthus annuus]KAJ0952946.1 hypothetical protein HanPSC8_Chr02g0078211 [Helianthus annuus]